MYPSDKGIKNSRKVSIIISGSLWDDLIYGQDQVCTLWVLSLSLLLDAYAAWSLLPRYALLLCAPDSPPGTWMTQSESLGFPKVQSLAEKRRLTQPRWSSDLVSGSCCPIALTCLRPYVSLPFLLSISCQTKKTTTITTEVNWDIFSFSASLSSQGSQVSLYIFR